MILLRDWEDEREMIQEEGNLERSSGGKNLGEPIEIEIGVERRGKPEPMVCYELGLRFGD